MASIPSWSDLPLDVLVLVIARLPYPADRARSRAVCRSWHSAVRRHGHQLPWIVRLNGEVCTLSDGRSLRMPSVPGGTICLGSWDDWLLLGFFRIRKKVYCIDSYLLHNEFSKTSIPLPELGFIVREDKNIRKFRVRSTADDFVIAAITTSLKHPLVVIKPGKGVWLPEPPAEPYVCIIDIAFLGDTLYAITRAEDLVPLYVTSDADGRPMVTMGRRVIRQQPDHRGFLWWPASDDEEENEVAMGVNDDDGDEEGEAAAVDGEDDEAEREEDAAGVDDDDDVEQKDVASVIRDDDYDVVHEEKTTCFDEEEGEVTAVDDEDDEAELEEEAAGVDDDDDVEQEEDAAGVIDDDDYDDVHKEEATGFDDDNVDPEAAGVDDDDHNAEQEEAASVDGDDDSDEEGEEDDDDDDEGPAAENGEDGNEAVNNINYLNCSHDSTSDDKITHWHLVESSGKLLMVRTHIHILPDDYSVLAICPVDVFEADMDTHAWVPMVNGLGGGRALFMGLEFSKSVFAPLGEVKEDAIYLIQSGEVFNMKTQTCSQQRFCEPSRWGQCGNLLFPRELGL